MMDSDIVSSVALATILEQLPLKVLVGDAGYTRITEIAIDSRRVQPGNLFVALKGETADGHDFILDAIRKGAAAVVGDQALSNLGVPYVQVENSRMALPWLAAAFHGFPGRNLTVVGITGTDGKTTTCNLLYQILLAAGLKTGLISSVHSIIGV